MCCSSKVLGSVLSETIDDTTRDEHRQEAGRDQSSRGEKGGRGEKADRPPDDTRPDNARTAHNQSSRDGNPDRDGTGNGAKPRSRWPLVILGDRRRPGDHRRGCLLAAGTARGTGHDTGAKSCVCVVHPIALCIAALSLAIPRPLP
jgi:hypothetical protein